MAKTIVREDPASGLKLYSEARTNPGGGIDYIFSLSSEAMNFSHLLPIDRAEPLGWVRAFDNISRLLTEKLGH